MDNSKRLFNFRPDSTLWDCLAVLVLCAGALFLFGWGIGSYSLNDPWEPRYAQAAGEMLERGEYITPYYKGYIRWTKPILIYWAMMASIKVWGANEFSARLPCVLAGAFGVLAMYFFLRRLRGRGAAFMGAAVLGTLPQYFFMARQAMPDMLMAAFLAAAMGFFALGRFGNENRRLYFALFYASVGLACLSKGPVACVIVLAAVIIFWLLDIEVKRPLGWRSVLSTVRETLSFYHVGLGVCVFAAIVAPWYATMLIMHGQNFVDHFIMGHNVRRFVEPWKINLRGTAAHYVETVFLGMYPWHSFLPASLFFLCIGRGGPDEESKQRWYYLSWFIAVFLVFTIAATKLDHYILPIAAPLAAIVAIVWEQYFREDAPVWARPALLLSLPFALIPFRDFLIMGDKYILDVFINKRPLVNVDVTPFLKWGFGLWAVVILAAFFKPRSRVIAALAVLLAYANGVYFCHYVLPKQEQSRSVKPYLKYLAFAKEYMHPDAVFVVYGYQKNTLTYYWDEKNYTFFEGSETDDLIEFVKDKSNVYILSQSARAGTLLGLLNELTTRRWFIFGRDTGRYDLIANTAPRHAVPERELATIPAFNEFSGILTNSAQPATSGFRSGIGDNSGPQRSSGILTNSAQPLQHPVSGAELVTIPAFNESSGILTNSAPAFPPTAPE